MLDYFKQRLSNANHTVYVVYIRKNHFEVFIIEDGVANSIVAPMTSLCSFKISSEKSFVNFRGTSLELIKELSSRLYDDEFVLKGCRL